MKKRPVRKTCFVIIPFSHAFDDVCDSIREVAEEEFGLEFVRGDLAGRPGSIMPQILHEIRRAAVVVADVTGHNPNVFYELGIAHQIRGPERVVLLTQEVDGKAAYDIHQYRQLEYAPTRNGLTALRQELPIRISRAMESSADEEFWNVIRGRLPRTRIIVRDLRRLIESAGKKGLAGVTIRVAAGLSSLAISDNEPDDSKLGSEYRKELREERDSLIEALLLGARLKAVLNPARCLTGGKLPERLIVRYKRLIGLLEGRSDTRGSKKRAERDLRAIAHCRFALSHVPMPNVFIIDNIVAYEGMKRRGAAGFDMTHCETDPGALREMIDEFDGFFEESWRDTQRLYPGNAELAKQLRKFSGGDDGHGAALQAPRKK